MSEPGSAELAAAIERRVREAPGVTEIFRPGGVTSQIVQAGAEMLGFSDGSGSRVRVEHGADGVRVGVSIGVRSTAGAVATARRVRATIDALCAEYGVVLTAADVTVVYVDASTG